MIWFSKKFHNANNPINFSAPPFTIEKKQWIRDYIFFSMTNTVIIFIQAPPSFNGSFVAPIQTPVNLPVYADDEYLG